MVCPSCTHREPSASYAASAVKTQAKAFSVCYKERCRGCSIASRAATCEKAPAYWRGLLAPSCPLFSCYKMLEVKAKR
jgi:hypothetical protein